MSMRLLLAEDDAMLGESLAQSLRAHDFVVDWVRDGASAIQALGGDAFDAVLLDIGLPQQDGFSVLNTLRARQDATPVIVITARDDIPDRVLGLDSGADDYLSKPFHPDELMARLRAVIRRRAGRVQPLIEHLDLTINPACHTALFRGKPVKLTRREFALLMILVERPGRVWSREQLITRLYGWSPGITSNSVEVHVHSLRKKLCEDFIVSIRGVGYAVRTA
jgi:two-component system response regulator QseB